MAAINTDKTEREASKKGLVDNFGRQTISDNAAYVASLSEEDRWRLVGRTYDQEQAFRAAHDQNPDGTAKFTQENIIGGVITVLLVAASAVVVGGLVIGGGAIGGAVLPATGGALPAAAGIAAPVSAIVIPASVPIATTKG